MIHILTKEEAWSTGAEETFIPIDRSVHKFRFRRRWFHLRNCCTFSSFLPQKFPPDKPYLMLTIGVFEGAQEVWMMQNLLKHEDSRLIAVDPWLAENKLNQQFMNQCMINAQHNLKPWNKQITIIQGASQRVLPKISRKEYETIPSSGFDLIIVDGDHKAQPVYEDAVNALALIKVGGWILFDDVRQQRAWQHRSGDHVIHGLQRFVDEHEDRLTQAWSHRFCETYERTN